MRKIVGKGGNAGNQDPEDRIFNFAISDISVVLRETTLTISDSIVTVSSVESEIVRMVYLSITKITEIKTKKKRRNDLQRMYTLI